jgi:hypothetical protein
VANVEVVIKHLVDFTVCQRNQCTVYMNIFIYYLLAANYLIITTSKIILFIDACQSLSVPNHNLLISSPLIHPFSVVIDHMLSITGNCLFISFNFESLSQQVCE